MTRSLFDIYQPDILRDRFSSPPDKDRIESWKAKGIIDSNGNLTEYGIKKGYTEPRIRGSETEEHYQQYRKDYAEYIKKYFDWLDNDGNPDNIPHLIERP